LGLVQLSEASVEVLGLEWNGDGTVAHGPGRVKRWREMKKTTILLVLAILMLFGLWMVTFEAGPNQDKEWEACNE
jgi:hypothetical protein